VRVERGVAIATTERVSDSERAGSSSHMIGILDGFVHTYAGNNTIGLHLKNNNNSLPSCCKGFRRSKYYLLTAIYCLLAQTRPKLWGVGGLLRAIINKVGFTFFRHFLPGEVIVMVAKSPRMMHLAFGQV